MQSSRDKCLSRCTKVFVFHRAPCWRKQHISIGERERANTLESMANAVLIPDNTINDCFRELCCCWDDGISMRCSTHQVVLFRGVLSCSSASGHGSCFCALLSSRQRTAAGKSSMVRRTPRLRHPGDLPLGLCRRRQVRNAVRNRDIKRGGQILPYVDRDHPSRSGQRIRTFFCYFVISG